MKESAVNEIMKLASDLPKIGPIQYRPIGESGLPTPLLKIIAAGQVLEEIDCSGCAVAIYASSVTLRSCRFTALDGVAMVVDMYDRCSDLTVEHCHFDGMKMDVRTNTMLRARDGTMTVRSCLFENLPNDGINLVAGSVERCVFRGSGYLTGAHADGIAIERTVGPILIMHNEIDYRTPPDAKAGTTSAIAIASGFGNVSDVLVEQNVLRGGAYAVYVREPPSTVAKYRCERVVIRDNLIADWMYGPLYPKDRPADLVFEGNRNPVNGGRIVAPPIPAR